MSIVFQSERFTPSQPTSLIINETWDEQNRLANPDGMVECKEDTEAKVWGMKDCGDDTVMLDTTMYDVIGKGRLRSTLYLTPNEARHLAMDLLSAAALASDESR
jgi:hypothetical protein